MSGLSIETRPCVGAIHGGDAVAVAPIRTAGYFTVQLAGPDDAVLGIALSDSHALGFVAFTRELETLDKMAPGHRWVRPPA